jgi:hypothetical protein
MRVEKRIFFSGINIVTHPHSRESYKKIITAMVSKRYSINTGGSHKLMIGTIDNYYDESENVFYGSLYRFTDIDINDKWFDLSSNEEAKKEDLTGINIPENLKPGLKSFYYVFFLGTHKLYFVSKQGNDSLPARHVEKLLTTFLTMGDFNKFESFKVTVIPDQQAVDSIISNKSIKKLTIDINKPNPDVPSNETDKEVQKRFIDERTRRITETLYAENGQHIIPSEHTTSFAKLASENGSVEIISDESGFSEIKSTKSSPLREMIKYKDGDSLLDLLVSTIDIRRNN